MIYIAGPFFNEDQVLAIEDIEDALETAGLEFFSPRSEGVIKNNFEGMSKVDKDAAIEKIYQSNINHIKSCDNMVVLLDGYDPGTLFEMGYAASLGKRIITLTGNDYGLNVMLSQCTRAHCNKSLQVARAFKGLSFKGFTPDTVT